jgi:NSS family neurotransmitter:Na+ symporter
MLKKQDIWSSKLNFILATTGAAVGLGNIWKFPYMAGENGGSAFFFIYILCILIIGIPLMIGEMLIGYMGKSDTVSSLEILAKKYKKNSYWSYVGWLGCITLVLVLSFYSVVAGWSIYYIKASLNNLLINTDSFKLQQLWSNLTNNPLNMLLYHSIFMFLTLIIVSRGIKQGLEKASRVMMPALFFILIILVGYASSTSGFNKGFNFLFHFDFSKITASVVISALGHACFTLAIGAGCILTYGSYLPQNSKIVSTVFIITILDVLVAIFSGMAIFPLVFSYNLEPTSGPGLMFQTLPIAFAKMGGGYWFGLLFFILLLFAAWTSTISIAEPLVALMIKRFNFNRKNACITVGLVAWAVGILTILSFNYLNQFKPLFDKNLFALITDSATNILLPLGILGFGSFVSFNLPKKHLYEALEKPNKKLFDIWYYTLKYISPVAILIILIEGIL